MAALPLQAPSVIIKSHQSLPQALVDRLGKLNAELAPLLNEQEAIKALLRESGLDVIEGDLFRCTISQGKPALKTNWQALAKSICSEARLAKLVPTFSARGDVPAARISVVARQGI